MAKKKKPSPTAAPPPSLTAPSEHPVYRTIKFPLKKVLRSSDALRIEEAVRTCHQVGTKVLELVKLYVTKLHCQAQPLPTLDSNFYMTAIRVVTIPRKGNGGRPLSKNVELHQSLLEFFNSDFLPLSPHNGRVEVSNLSHILKYMSQTLETVQTTNITKNFPVYLRRYVNTFFRSQLYTAKNWPSDYRMNRQERTALYLDLKEVKDDLLLYRKWNGGYLSKPEYHSWLDDACVSLIPAPLDTTHEWGLYQDVRLQPQAYISHMLDINVELEVLGAKLLSPLCLRTALSPRYIKLDTSALIDLLMTDEDIRDLRAVTGLDRLTGKGALLGSPNQLFERKVDKKEAFAFNTLLWRQCMRFDTNKYTRGLLESKHYVFDNSILTDGVGVSVLQIRKDRLGVSCKANNSVEFRFVETDVPYITDLSEDEKRFLTEKAIVIGNDPGTNNIMYMTDGHVRLRYTAQQRAVEGRFKKNKRAIVSMKKTTVCSNGQTVEQAEQSIVYNSKSSVFSRFKEYIQARRDLEHLVCEAMYYRPVLRKLRFSTQVHVQKSEDQLLRRIQSTFCRSGESPIVIAWGDWSRAQNFRCGPSTPGIGIRKRLSRKGRAFGIYIGLVHEAYSSYTCHTCHDKTDYFKTRTYTKGGVRQTRDVHGLLRCQNETCSKLWNRDLNGSSNIREIGLAALRSLPRPSHFCASAHAINTGSPLHG